MGRTARRSALILVTAAFAASVLPAGVVLAAEPSTPATSPGTSAAERSVALIVTYENEPGKAAERAVRGMGGKVKTHLKLIDGLAIDLPRGQVKQLKKDPTVKSVEVDGRLTAFDHTPNTGDLEYENAWGVEHIGTREVHLAGNTGQGIKVAVIDTGIDYIHNDPDDQPYVVDPEFSGNYRGGYDFFNDDADPYDDNGHGTHVAGILAAEHNGYLVTGVAPSVDLYALKVLSAAGEGEYSGLIAALGWAVDNDMDVVNMSLGGHEVSSALQTAIAAAYDAGITLVAASGNVNPGSIQELLYGCPVAYPAAYDQVIAVSFTNTADKLTGFSCIGAQVDLAAPGDQIFSPVPMGPTGSCMFCSPYGYSAQSGTSMASPHVAGVVALTLGAGIADGNDDGLLADDVKAHLCAQTSPASGMTTTDPRYPNWYGCGIVDADKALIDVPPTPPTPGVTAVPDNATTAEDTPTDVDVLANDSDPDNDPISVTAVTDPAHGTTSVDTDGSVLYAPDPDYNGPDTFDYTISDDGGDTATATVSVTVTPANDPPQAVADELVTSAGTPASIAPLANDTDVDGDSLAVTTVSTPANGTTALVGDSITYTPDSGFSGSDSFTYDISDGAGGTATGTVSVTVVLTNSPPVAVDDVATVEEDTTATIDAAANDTDADGGVLRVTAVSQPSHGTATVDEDGRIAYTPSANYHGPDAFTYTVADAIGATDQGFVAVTVTPGNDPPVAVDDNATTQEDVAVDIDVTGNDTDLDGDTLTVTAVAAPALGSVAIQADGTVRYTPSADYAGADSFGYTVSDGAGGTDTGTVSITVTPTNDAPVAGDKSATTAYETAATITMTGSDVETCDLTFQVVTPPAHGTLGSPSNVLCVTLLPPYADSSKIVYTPTAGYHGPDSFTYRTSDGSSWSTPATVSITVTAPALLHVADLDPSRRIRTTTWLPIVTITVHSASHGIVSGVTVTGTWSGGATGSASCNTGTKGTCQVSTGSYIAKSIGSVTFTVTGMAKRSYAYSATANHDPDPDSTGTVVVVTQVP